MTITSYLFWLLFLPLSLLLYWYIVRTPRQKLWLLLSASIAFYTLADARYLVVLLALSVFTFWAGQRQRFQWAGILINVLVLILFKIWVLGVFQQNAPALQLALPLGLSFFVFKHIGYLFDVRQKRYAPTTNLLLFVTFSAFFPQISAGPISSFGHTGPQLGNLPMRPQSDQLYRGVVHLSYGLAKKLLIADVLSRALQENLYALNHAGEGMTWAWASVIIFALQLYFDFSGYTDMVLGIALLFGVELPPNFNNPYWARTPREFWQRWHISLSSWFRVYVFMPLSRFLLRRWGSKRSNLAQFVSSVVTMGLVGLWHGLNAPYFLWGIYHGALLHWTRPGAGVRVRMPAIVAHGLTLIAILMGWALFLSPNTVFAGDLFAHMIGVHGRGPLSGLLQIYDANVWWTVFAAILVIVSGVAEAADFPVIKRPVYLLGFGMLFALCILHMGTVVQFLYVQF